MTEKNFYTEWLYGKVTSTYTRVAAAVVIITAILTSVTAFWTKAGAFFGHHPGWADCILPVLNLLLVLVMAYFANSLTTARLTQIMSHSIASPRTKALTQAFSRWWLYLLYSWAALYIVLLVWTVPPIKDAMSDSIRHYKTAMLNIVGVFTNVCLVTCYRILRIDDLTKAERPWPLFGFVFLCLALCSVAGTAARATEPDVFRWIQLIDPIVSATLICLLVGRLESLFLGGPQWLTVILYLYGICQLGAVSMSDSSAVPGLEAAFFLLMFVCKAFFATFIYVCLVQGKLLDYARQVQAYYETRASIDLQDAT